MNISKAQWKNWDIVSFDGKFVVRYLTSIRNVFEELEKKPNPNIVLDLSKTSHIDSSALTIMLNLQKRLKIKNGTMAVFGANEDVMDVFSIVGFDKLVPIFATRQSFEDALNG